MWTTTATPHASWLPRSLGSHFDPLLDHFDHDDGLGDHDDGVGHDVGGLGQDDGLVPSRMVSQPTSSRNYHGFWGLVSW